MNSREAMIRELRQRYGFNDGLILWAIGQVPREEFVSKELKDLAYEDRALSIGQGQTISQPYTVAFMTSLLELSGRQKVLEIGTGSGYQAAILSFLVKKVYSVERIKPLAQRAHRTLKRLGYKNVQVRWVGKQIGWPQKAPFDAILVTADIRGEVPKQLFDQLAANAILVAPVNGEMIKFVKKGKKIERQSYGRFSFVPFIE